jgi:hypothetical protein
MKSRLILITCLISPFFGMAQVDTTSKKAVDTTIKSSTDTTVKSVDTTMKMTIDTAMVVKKDTVDTRNCYTVWYDFMRTRGAKPVTDGTQEVVIAFKSGETCLCFMGKIAVAGGKIKPPLYIQAENGEYKLSTDLGKKLDAEFVASIGADLWNISDGMSTLFRTADQEYGRLFFYKFANKGANSKKEAPSPSELIKE